MVKKIFAYYGKKFSLTYFLNHSYSFLLTFFSFLDNLLFLPTAVTPSTLPVPRTQVTIAPSTARIQQCTSGWSSWINKVDPTSGTGDYEKMSKEELEAFCPGGSIIDIECKDSVSKDDWTSLAESTCSVEDGLKCDNLPFDGVPPCRNYEIRYKCNCSSNSFIHFFIFWNVSH